MKFPLHNMLRFCAFTAFTLVLSSTHAMDSAAMDSAAMDSAHAMDSAATDGTHAMDSAATDKEVRLSSSVSAFVQKILVSMGDRVKAGQTLIELMPDAARYDVQARKSQSQLANMELSEAKAQFARQRELFDIGSLSSVELERHRLIMQRKQTAFDVADAESGKAKLKLAQHKVKAPVTAIVKSINVSVGEFVNAAVENKTLLVLTVE